MIVNREFAEHYWPHQVPIRRHMRLGTLKSRTPWMTVVDEMADAKLGSPDHDAREQFLKPVAQINQDWGAPPASTGLDVQTHNGDRG